MLRTKTRRIAIMLIFVCASTSLAAEPGPAITGKKIIGFACDKFNAMYLAQHVDEVEQMPVDGLIVSVHDDQWMGCKDQRNNLWFGGVSYTRQDFAEVIAALKAAKFKRFTDNFMDFPLTVNDTSFIGPDGKLTPAPPGCTFAGVDWFDDAWSKVAQNGAVAAYVAREGGMKGLFMDGEGYRAGRGVWPHPFSYQGYLQTCKARGLTPRTPDECMAQVRKRGREFIEAIVEVYPDITIIVIPSIGSVGDALPPHLFSAFADGMLEGSGPEVTFVDAMEGGYPLLRYDSMARHRRFMEKDNLEKSAISDIFNKRVSYGLGLWVDFECLAGGPFPGWHTDDPAKFDLNYRSPERLEHSLYNALTVSDRYVWLYVWHPRWWWKPHVREQEHINEQLKNQCPLCPHGEMPQAYLDALKNCRRPHNLHWGEERMRELEERTWYAGYLPAYMKLQVTDKDLTKIGKNLLINGGFERIDPSSARFAPVSWAIAGQGPLATRDQDFVKESTYSVRLTTTRAKGHVFLDQVIPAEPLAGKVLIFGAWLKVDGNGSSADVQILDVDETRKHEVTAAQHLGDDVWRFVAVRKRIRKNAVGNVTLRISSRALTGSVIYMDGAVAVVEK